MKSNYYTFKFYGYIKMLFKVCDKVLEGFEEKKNISLRFKKKIIDVQMKPQENLSSNFKILLYFSCC